MKELDEWTKKRIKKMLRRKRRDFEKDFVFWKAKFNGNRFNGNRINNIEKCLRRIDEAIERVDQGIYGICQSCKKQIPLGRLAAVPWTRFCVDCKNKNAEE